MSEQQRRCGNCCRVLPETSGPGRARHYCDATCRSAARRARTPPAAARCSLRAGVARCGAAATGAWYDQRGRIAAHTCDAHRDLSGELLGQGMPKGPALDRWLPANVAWHPPEPATPAGPAVQLRITLARVHPPVWRRVHVPADIPLSRLHEIVQVAMGWSGMHLWRFAPCYFGRVDGEYDPTLTLDGVLSSPGDQLGYVYDFGDYWVHLLEMEKLIAKPRAQVPRCTAGRRACPPEDSGGPYGYAEALRGLRARKGLRYRLARDTLGRGFNPEQFNADHINDALAALSP